MRLALDLAQAQLGHTAPNPSVGCVIVKNNEIIAKGATGLGGRPHAEEIALERAKHDAIGADLYVTLEPCAQRSSNTPSCSERIIQAQIGRVIFAVADPNPKAKGGARLIEKAGIQVIRDVLNEEARAQNIGFFTLNSTGKPYLAIDTNPLSYDAELTIKLGESPDQALSRLGQAGLTRLYIKPDTPLAEVCQAQGLIIDKERF